METKGLLMVFTSTGKGKIMAALGMALRASGHGLPVCVIQFIKGNWRYGELDALPKLGVELHTMGRGFTWKSDNLDEDRRLALEGWNFARERMGSGRYHMIILDEFTYLLHYQMLDLAPCLETLDSAFSQKNAYSGELHRDRYTATATATRARSTIPTGREIGRASCRERV